MSLMIRLVWRKTFVKWCQILDDPMIMNEVVWCKLNKKKDMVFEIYFKEVYDSIRWFLNEVMSKLTLDPSGEVGCKVVCIQTWVRLWSMEAIQRSSGFTGSSTCRLNISFLFIIVVESLHMTFHTVVQSDLFTNILIGVDNYLSVYHLITPIFPCIFVNGLKYTIFAILVLT